MKQAFCFFLLLLNYTDLTGQGYISGGKLIAEQANMDIRKYSLVLTVDPAKKTIGGHTDILLVLKAPATKLLLDLDSVYTIENVWVDERKQSFTHQSGRIHIQSADQLSVGRHMVRVKYAGSPHVAVKPPWEGGIQWSKDSLGRDWIAMSCQEDGPDIFFPCKDHPSDEPDEGADMAITVPAGLVVAGPGLLTETRTQGKFTTWKWNTSYTINNYCIVFNVGHYVVEKKNYRTVNGNNVPMEFYVLDYHKNKAAKHLELLSQSTILLEKYFGEYPFVKEKIGIVETPHLGMEHQTMNAYGNQFRYTKMGKVDFDWLMHHEFGHEWWANKVSNRDWGHMWIQEGICSFGDVLFYEEFGGRNAYLSRMKQIALEIDNELPIVQGDVVDSRQAYHSDIYGKGAFFMHTLRYVLGDEVFFPALRSFATSEKYTYSNLVTTDDVLRHFNLAAGKELKPLFQLFLYKTDKLKIRVHQQSVDTWSISTENLNMTIPLEVQTTSGIKKIMVSRKPVTIFSDNMPLIDTEGYYLKSVTYD